MKITYRIPSKKVPYGYVEMVDENATMPQPDELAQWYANFISQYQAAEVAAFEQPTKVAKPKPVPEDDINDIASDLIKDGLGATELSPEEAAKPWNKTGSGSMDGYETDEPTTSKAWEESKAEPSVDDTDWDF